jgi:hypothetical protein
VKLRAYSSISAFLAHYHALRAAAGDAGGGAQRPLTADERSSLADMDALLRDTLTEGERVALGLDGTAAPAASAAGAAVPSTDAAATPPGASSAGGSPPHDVAGREEAPLRASSRPATTTHPATNGATARRRARAELKLRHALAARSLLTP